MLYFTKKPVLENPLKAAGHLVLKREHESFDACFCIIRDTLPQLARRLALLHPVEQAYYNGLKFDKRKLSYLLGRQAAKTAVALLAGVEDLSSFYIGAGVFQFPVVKELPLRNIQVSISHCEQTGIALAFPEEHPLGIDIEKIEDDKAAIIKDYLSAREYELAMLCGLPAASGCFMMWTIKEALTKILRTGLTTDLHMIELASLERTGTTYTSTFRHFTQYKALSCQHGDYICSLVLPARTTPEMDTFWHSFISSTGNLV